MSESSAKTAQGLQRLLDVFALVPDRSERIQLLMDLADRFREVPESVATRPYGDEHKVPACESEAFLYAEPRADGTLDLHFAVENPQGISAKAMAVILSENLSGEPLESVLATPGDLPLLFFGKELSMGKSMGLMGMVAMVHATAKRALRAKNA